MIEQPAQTRKRLPSPSRSHRSTGAQICNTSAVPPCPLPHILPLRHPLTLIPFPTNTPNPPPRPIPHRINKQQPEDRTISLRPTLPIPIPLPISTCPGVGVCACGTGGVGCGGVGCDGVFITLTIPAACRSWRWASWVGGAGLGQFWIVRGA